MTMGKYYVIALLIFTACSSASDKAALEEAASSHHEALAVAKAISEKLTRWKSDSVYQVPVDSLVQWQQALAVWQESVVEVPGYEHEHDHDHEDHHHHHHTTVAVSAEDIIKIQRELLERIESLHQRILIYDVKPAEEK